MNQEQTIDDILKMLKDSVNDENTSNQEVEDAAPFSVESDVFEMSEETLKQHLQKQYGDSMQEAVDDVNDPYAFDEEFLQQAAEEEIEEEIEEIEEIEESAEETKVVGEKKEYKPVVAMDYSFEEEEEEIFCEILPKLSELKEQEAGETALVLRDQCTDAVPVATVWESDIKNFSENESDDLSLLSGITYTTPALTASLDSESMSDYELLCQLGCEDEWTAEEPKQEELKVSSEELSEYESYDQTSTVLASYQKKKMKALFRLIGVGLGAILLLIYETLPLFGVPFGGIIDYQEYIGSYLLFGFQLLLICAVILWKPMAKGVRRLFTLHPNVYSLAALLVICVGIYDVVAVFTLHTWIMPFHASAAILLVLLALGDGMMISREQKVFSVFCADPDRRKYTLSYQKEDDPCVVKMRRGGLSVDSRIATPEICEFPHGFFRSVREDVFETRMISFLLIPCLLLGLISAVLMMFLNRELPATMLTAISALMLSLPMGATLAGSLPLWISANRLAKRQIALLGTRQIQELTDTDVLVFEDFHLFRPCSTKDTGIAFFEKQQTATVLGCLECLYATIGGPLSEAFANVPAQYRFQNISIRRLVRGGVEALVERKHVLLVGDEAFMKRYGLVFPHREEKAGRMTVYISLDGKISAKMSVRYPIEPVFEMLAERLAREGVQCVIKTFDPMISAAQISALRSFGDAPISVVHQGISDIKTSAEHITKGIAEDPSVLAVASRFKLAEAIVWGSSLLRIRRANHAILGTFTALGVVLTGLLIGFGQFYRMNQYWLILWGALANLCVVFATLVRLPSKKYFSVDVCCEEWQKKRKKKGQKRKTST